MTRSDNLALVREYCAKHAQAVLFDETGETLFDVAGAKTLPLRLDDVAAVEARTNQVTQVPYLLLRYSDGHELALSDVGIAFAPRITQTGPIEELPAVSCLRDYATLVGRIEHELYGHFDQPPTRETVRVVLMCIAILDGARTVGFDVDRETGRLEEHLSEIERRSPAAKP